MDGKLAGFVADIVGRESSLTWGDPVVEVGATRYVARGGYLEGDSAVRLSARDQEFVWPLRGTELHYRGESREVVWLVGPRFFNAVGAYDELKPLWRELGSWRTGPRGFRYRLGSLDALDGLRQKYSKLVRDAIYGWLTEPLTKESRAAGDDLLRIHGTIDVQPSLDRAVSRALVFKRLGSLENYQLERDRVGVDGRVGDRWRFDLRVKKGEKWLRQANRLHHVTVQSTMPHEEVIAAMAWSQYVAAAHSDGLRVRPGLATQSWASLLSASSLRVFESGPIVRGGSEVGSREDTFFSIEGLPASIGFDRDGDSRIDDGVTGRG